jgi:hypothetical protein
MTKKSTVSALAEVLDENSVHELIFLEKVNFQWSV